MDINQTSNNIALRPIQNLKVTDSKSINAETASNSSITSQSLSPLTSRYTYAMGQDGRRYILQLRIDIASMNGFSALA